MPMEALKVRVPVGGNGLPLVRRSDGVLVPQDDPQPPRSPLTEGRKFVASLLGAVRDENLRRFADDLPFLTQAEQDALVLKEYRRRGSPKIRLE